MNLSGVVSKAEISKAMPKTNRFSITPSELHRALNSQEERAVMAQ